MNMTMKTTVLMLVLSMSLYAANDEVLNPQQYNRQTSHYDLLGMNIKLNIPMSLQTRTETIAERAKNDLKADEIIALIMESKSGKILSMASSNRYDPNEFQGDHNISSAINAIEYSVESGTIIKPIIFSLLLDKGLVNPSEMVDCHNGKYTLGEKVIEDVQKYNKLSAEDVIVRSSYIGMVQLAQRLKGHELSEGLNRFGFAHFSGTDLPYERRGSLPNTEKLEHHLYKAIISYGYGMSANTMQLIKAYNVFNNKGLMVTPMVVNSFIDNKGKIQPIVSSDPIQVISPATAQRMKQILIKTVNEGSATIAKTQGVEVGGKTGAVHLANERQNINAYNTSFIGFVNDAKRAYTIAILIREPRIKYSPSVTAVPVFKAIVDMMVEEKYLKPRV